MKNKPKEKTQASVNKGGLISSISELSSLSKTDSTRALEALMEAIINSFKNGNEVRIANFGAFKIVERAERVGRNPKTGDALKIPATKFLKFQPSKVLKETIA